MSEYYTPQRAKTLYEKNEKQAFKLSRTKIELFLECQLCFYLDRKLGVARPPSFPFTLNSAVDNLLKQEFDIHRAKDTKHPLIEKYGIDARLIANDNLEKWRNNFVGIQYTHKPTNFLIYGAIDDLWQNSKEEFIVVDYKATAVSGEITTLDKEWHKGYKRQMEIYQWLLRMSGYKVSKTGYFVYCNGKRDKKAFDGKLEFDVTLIPYDGDDNWVEKTIFNIHDCLNNDTPPKPSNSCDYCSYRKAVENVIL